MATLVSSRYLPLMEIHPLATLLDRFHHLVRGFVVQGAGHLKQILDRRSLREGGNEPADQLGSSPLLGGRELVQVAQDLCFDGWHDHAGFASLARVIIRPSRGRRKMPVAPGK